MKVYLAGKITRDPWRSGILGGAQIIDPGAWRWDGRWPVLPRVVLGTHDYVGPYYCGDSNHGPMKTNHAAPPIHDEHDSAQMARPEIVRLCLEALSRADLLFVWLDSLDAFGTLVEIGFARAHGIPIIIGQPSRYSDHYFYRSSGYEDGEPEGGELWFARASASVLTWAPKGVSAVDGAEHCLRSGLAEPLFKRWPLPPKRS